MKFCRLLSNRDKCILMFMYCSLIISGAFFICFLVYLFVFADADRQPEVRKHPMTKDEFALREFERYLKRFNKTYQKEELRKRFENFKGSLIEIGYLNRPYFDGPRFGPTKYTDMSPEEFASARLMKGVQPECKERDKNCFDQYQNRTLESHDTNRTDKDKEHKIPLLFDWRDHGVVGPVLNQRRYCLNSWAFTIIGIMESMLLISNKTIAYSRLSVQELTDCSTFTNKCEDSSLVAAVHFICNKKWPIIPEGEYPMTLKAQNCSIPQPTQGALINRFQVKCDLGPIEIADIIANHGPVAAAVNARPWRNYRGGVLHYSCSGLWTHTNHVVQIVGYDMTVQPPYFIVRNSWGADFGDRGYVYVAMDYFLCAIGRQITFFNATFI